MTPFTQIQSTLHHSALKGVMSLEIRVIDFAPSQHINKNKDTNILPKIINLSRKEWFSVIDIHIVHDSSAGLLFLALVWSWVDGWWKTLCQVSQIWEIIPSSIPTRSTNCSLIKPSYTVRGRYNAVNFLQNPHKRRLKSPASRLFTQSFVQA